MSIGQELLNVPFAEMVQKLALSVAESQSELDRHSTDVAKYMADQKIMLPDLSNPSGPGKEFSLVSMGFLPAFYAVQEAEIEVKMAISMTKQKEKSGSASVKGGWGPVAAQVNASYSSRYAYSQEGASRLTIKLAPADPPILLQKYMEAVTAAMLAENPVMGEDPDPEPEPAPQPRQAGKQSKKRQ
ncbi:MULTISPECIES: hypothetical protein [unclassified Ruegeria]|uniref:hypothetical protein n=1 Tax=unclassified Ruegeria TaxID=2625375 RepID=UPI001489C8B9|nr:MULTISPECIES: hypothetical protein [unclassified Ruegeria]NOD91076.1 hypothetical protein [Ruegeria sp. HKCCD4318]NOE16273.1 hypothetical protein [Ruegeria sp. HKCCD4318-2]NOG07472.1 hypothetical protein [Ruegeria sp. HKCCD4315]